MLKAIRTNQTGSVKLFVTIGIILTLVLIGSIYILIQRGQKVRHDDVIAVVDQQFEAEKIKNDENKLANSNKNDNNVSVPNFTEDKNIEVLPTTGSEINIFELLGAGLITFSIFSYLKSFRNQYRSL